MNVAKIIILSCIQDKNKGYFVSCDYNGRNFFLTLSPNMICAPAFAIME